MLCKERSVLILRGGAQESVPLAAPDFWRRTYLGLPTRQHGKLRITTLLTSHMWTNPMNIAREGCKYGRQQRVPTENRGLPLLASLTLNNVRSKHGSNGQK